MLWGVNFPGEVSVARRGCSGEWKLLWGVEVALGSGSCSGE
ncbi:MAG TPA: hypothetical protein P5543_03545 [Planctomycetota bacterium]|nr:hypothetical protein [Planctomycetota bacterium]